MSGNIFLPLSCVCKVGPRLAEGTASRGPPRVIGAFASFGKEGAPCRGRRGCFVRTPSEAPAERWRANRQILQLAPSRSRCKSHGPIGAMRRDGRTDDAPNRIPFGTVFRSDCCRTADMSVKVNEFSLVPVSSNPQVKESGRAFAPFVAGVRTKGGFPCGGRKGVVRSVANFPSPSTELGKFRTSNGSTAAGYKVEGLYPDAEGYRSRRFQRR